MNSVRLRSADGNRGQRIAQRRRVRILVVRTAVRLPAVKVDELAELVDVLDRVLERRLPGRQQDGR
jgi:hypothetical protein